MRATQLLLVTMTGATLLTAALARGQGALQKLENQFGGAPAAKAPASPAPATAAPATPGGYLGGAFDEPLAGQKGVLVTSVRRGAPAEAGGLKANDLITAVDGKAVTNLDQFFAVLDKSAVGQTLRLTVNRMGRTENLTVKLGAQPPQPSAAEQNPGGATPPAPPGPSRLPVLGEPSPALGSPNPDRPAAGGAFSPPSSRTPPADAGTLPPPAPDSRAGSGIRALPLDLGPPPATAAPSETPLTAEEPAPGPAPSSAAPAAGSGPSLGITVDTLTDDARQAYGLTVRRGALITGVRAGTPADRAGLPIGGAVVALDGRRIDSADDLVALIRAAQPGQEIELTYYEGNRIARKSVTLAPATAAAAPGSMPRPPATMPGGMSGERPLLGRVERMVDGFARGGVSGPSTVYDPSVVAALQSQVAELNATVKSLEERLRVLEGNRPPPATATPAPALTPGFGTAPIGPTTPGFVPGLPPPGTNP